MLLRDKKIVYIKALDHFTEKVKNVDIEELPNYIHADNSFIEVIGCLIDETQDYYVLLIMAVYIEYSDNNDIETEREEYYIAKILKSAVIEMKELSINRK
jgi:hypothetical protein